jgi:hypothetical protein
VRERLARDRERFKDYDDLKSRAAEADKNKSALDKLLEKVSGLEERASKAEAAALRADVAQAKGLTPTQAKRLQGKTREELEADADELLSMFKPADKDGKGEEGKGEGSEKTGGKDTGTGETSGTDEGRKLPPSSRPKEKLTSGAVPATSGDADPGKLAEQILSDF